MELRWNTGSWESRPCVKHSDRGLRWAGLPASPDFSKGIGLLDNEEVEVNETPDAISGSKTPGFGRLTAIAAITLAILALDAWTPLGVATGLAYVVPVLMAAQLRWLRAPLAFAAVGAALVVVGYYISPPPVAAPKQTEWVVIANRILSIMAIAVTAILALWWQQYATQLRRERAQLRTVVDTSADAVLTLDETGVIRSFSRAGEALFGFVEGEMVGQNIDMLSPPNEETRSRVSIAQAFRSANAGAGKGGDATARRRDGSVFPVHVTVGEMPGSSPHSFTLFIHDRSRRAAIEQALARENGFITAVLDTTDALVIVIDPQGRIVRWNRACERTSGFTAEEMKGQQVWPLIPEESRAAVKRVMADILAASAPLRHESEWITKAGKTRLILWSAAAIRNAEEGALIVGTGVDITERRRVEDQAQRLQQDLYRIGRLSELGEMASAIAHELNQPLTALANYAAASRRLIEGGTEDGKAKATGLLGKVVEQSQRAGQIIHRLRDLIGRGQTELNLADVNATVREASSLAMVGAANLGIEARYELVEGLPAVPLNKTQIQQVVFNLVRNAVEAMEADENARPKLVTVSTRLTGAREIEISVADTGPGLASEVEDNLFAAFLTTKPRGMGIGLSICRSIVDAHGGTIEGVNKESGGAEFRFTLPATEEMA